MKRIIVLGCVMQVALMCLACGEVATNTATDKSYKITCVDYDKDIVKVDGATKVRYKDGALYYTHQNKNYSISHTSCVTEEK